MLCRSTTGAAVFFLFPLTNEDSLLIIKKKIVFRKAGFLWFKKR